MIHKILRGFGDAGDVNNPGLGEIRLLDEEGVALPSRDDHVVGVCHDQAGIKEGQEAFNVYSGRWVRDPGDIDGPTERWNPLLPNEKVAAMRRRPAYAEVRQHDSIVTNANDDDL